MRTLLLSTVLGVAALSLPTEAWSAPADRPLPATLRVRLPADARLTIDDHATTSTSATRSFITPPLPAGKDCHYTLKAEFVRDGKTITVSETVMVRGGQETAVSLDLPAVYASSVATAMNSSVALSRNFWIDTRTGNQYFVAAQYASAPGATETRSYYYASGGEERRADGGNPTTTAVPPLSAYLRVYPYRVYYPGSSSSGSSSSRVAPMSEQDPLKGTGPPGNDNPLSVPTSR